MPCDRFGKVQRTRSSMRTVSSHTVVQSEVLSGSNSEAIKLTFNGGKRTHDQNFLVRLSRFLLFKKEYVQKRMK